MDKTPQYLSKNCFICSTHFESHFLPKFINKRSRLIQNAKPTIFNIPNPPPQTGNKRTLPSRSAFSGELSILYCFCISTLSEFLIIHHICLYSWFINAKGKYLFKCFSQKQKVKGEKATLKLSRLTIIMVCSMAIITLEKLIHIEYQHFYVICAKHLHSKLFVVLVFQQTS